MFRRNPGAWALLVLGALQILVPLVIFPACTGKMELASGAAAPMKCHWYALFEAVLGALLLVQAASSLFLREPRAKACAAAVTLSTGLATVLLGLDGLVGVCKGPVMACHMATRPALSVLGGLTICISTLLLIQNLRLPRRGR